MNIESIFRKNILDLVAYSSARSLNTKGEVFLDANESALPPYLEGQLSWDHLKSYPEPQPQELISQLASFYQVTPSQLLVGRGSDEAIDLLTRAVCEPNTKDTILITPPTYGMYKVSADIQNVTTLSVPLISNDTSWFLDVENIKNTLSDPDYKVKLLYICSPNNPTGDLLQTDDIKEICKSAPEWTLVVIDEAYAEFSGQSLTSLMSEFSNVVVLRTLSKAWALAGLRCGSLIADPKIISVLQKVRAPYPLSQPVIDLATQAMTTVGKAEMLQRVRTLNSERESLKQALLKLPSVVKIYESKSNFLLVEFKKSMEVMETALSHGMILRNRTQDVQNCIRITVGTQMQNEFLIRTLEKGLQ